MAPWPLARFVVTSVVVVAAVFASVGLLALLNPSPAAGPPTNSLVIGNERYDYENVTVREPGWSNFVFLGVAFEFHAWCSPLTPGGTSVCGNATPLGGAPHPFTFREGPPPNSTQPWQTWISPTGHEGVQFQSDSGGLARLLVVA